ncbi:hypothetical protein CAL7716_057500 [Calothrix sp. PCC 7716]|nr:hypothetical protein CAL7716_057500 [Calothrix sp. PCC 7716]
MFNFFFNIRENILFWIYMYQNGHVKSIKDVKDILYDLKHTDYENLPRPIFDSIMKEYKDKHNQ